MTKALIIGAKGRMGKIAIEAIRLMEDFTVIAEVGRGQDLDAALKKTKPDIAIELSTHESVKENSWIIVRNNVRLIIGASGLKKQEIEELEEFCKENKLGGIVAPNFSLGMALSNKMAREMSLYFNDISIVEFHHAQKKDKPSGTARYTAELCGVNESDIVSIRSNGFLAKQQVLISGEGERLVIDHESFNRDSFRKGIQLCCKKVLDLNELKIGLENII